MKSYLPIGLAFFILVWGLTACQQPAGSTSAGVNGSSGALYTNQVLPKTLTVPVPGALTNDSSTGNTSGALTAASSVTSSPTPAPVTTPAPAPSTYAPQAGGYYQIKGMVSQMEYYIPTLEAYAVIVDAAIGQNNLTPVSLDASPVPTPTPGASPVPNTNPTPVPSLTVTVTQAIYNAVAAALPAHEQVPPFLVVGQTLTLPTPAYTYDSSTVLAYTFGFALSRHWTLAYSWSTDQTKLKMTLTDTTRSFGSMTIEVATDLTAQSTAFQVSDSTNDLWDMFIQSDPASTTGGVFANLNLTYGFAANEIYGLWGYADTNGGLVTTDVSRTSWFTGALKIKEIEEGFNASGVLEYAATSTDGAAWKPTPFNNATYSPTGTYGTDSAEAQSSKTFAAQSLL